MATTWTLDPTHSEVTFKVKHLVISTVTGHFRQFDAKIESPTENNFDGAAVSFDLDVNSIDTNQTQRDEHLRSADFFDAGQYPQISLKNAQLVKKDEESYALKGDLTIKGNTQPVTFDVDFNGATADPYGNFKAGFDGSTEISRKAFGLTWDAVTETGSVVVGDKIKIIASVQFVKQ
jgi:polyisoprenoid-binding protein YceI